MRRKSAFLWGSASLLGHVLVQSVPLCARVQDDSRTERLMHARRVQRGHFSPFSLNVQLWRASLIVQRVRERGRTGSTSAPTSRCTRFGLQLIDWSHLF